MAGLPGPGSPRRVVPWSTLPRPDPPPLSAEEPRHRRHQLPSALRVVVPALRHRWVHHHEPRPYEREFVEVIIVHLHVREVRVGPLPSVLLYHVVRPLLPRPLDAPRDSHSPTTDLSTGGRRGPGVRDRQWTGSQGRVEYDSEQLGLVLLVESVLLQLRVQEHLPQRQPDVGGVLRLPPLRLPVRLVPLVLRVGPLLAVVVEQLRRDHDPCPCPPCESRKPKRATRVGPRSVSVPGPVPVPGTPGDHGGWTVGSGETCVVTRVKEYETFRTPLYWLHCG